MPEIGFRHGFMVAPGQECVRSNREQSAGNTRDIQEVVVHQHAQLLLMPQLIL